MGKKQILKLLVPIVIVTTMSALSEAVAKNVAYGNQLIRIYFLSFFLFGFLAYWTLVKLGIG